MSMSQADQQFLPLDSGIKSSSIHGSSSNFENNIDSMCGQQSQVSFLMSKISELQKNYIQLEKKYVRKIKDLKEQLIDKHQVQSSLNQELSALSKQYEQHKSEIQKISAQIKKSLEQSAQRQQKQAKIKSVSPKNHNNASPKRLIKKSLQMVKKQVLLPRKQPTLKEGSSSNQINISTNTQRSDRKIGVSQEMTHEQKKMLIVEEDNLKNSNENSLNSSNQLKNGRKPLYSPSNATNGPSPKKRLLFNSSKQLDLFSKPLPDKKAPVLINNSPKRRINISPKQKQKETILGEHKVSQKQMKVQLKGELPVIQQKPYKPENDAKKNSLTGSVQTSSPAHRKKAPSPESIGFLRKKISNKNLTIKTQTLIPFEDKKSADTSLNVSNQKTNLSGKQEKKESANISNTKADGNNIGKEEKKETKASRGDLQQSKKIEVEKKANKSPGQSSKNIKTSPQSKYSPARKLLRNSPTHKKAESGAVQKPKLLANMRQKFDDNIFK